MSNIPICFRILAQNTKMRHFGRRYPNKAFLVQNLGIFVFCKILQLDRFEGADFKYDNSFLKF